MSNVAEPRINWSRNEVILACAVLVDNSWKWMPPTDDRISTLSQLLHQSSEYPVEERGEKFRNPNGVARKMSDLFRAGSSTWNAVQ